jgi:hypothetical protein
MATEEDQSSNVYDNVAYMLQNGEAANEFAFDLGRSVQTSTRIYLKGVESAARSCPPRSSGDS